MEEEEWQQRKQLSPSPLERPSFLVLSPSPKSLYAHFLRKEGSGGGGIKGDGFEPYLDYAKLASLDCGKAGFDLSLSSTTYVRGRHSLLSHAVVVVGLRRVQSVVLGSTM